MGDVLRLRFHELAQEFFGLLGRMRIPRKPFNESALAGDYCLAFHECRGEVPRLAIGEFLVPSLFVKR